MTRNEHEDFSCMDILGIKSMAQEMNSDGMALTVVCRCTNDRELALNFHRVRKFRMEWKEGGAEVEVGEMIISMFDDRIVVGDELTNAYHWIADVPLDWHWVTRGSWS